mmetsp:Transcript_143295/g.399465  ORF Transcript_143295/g.399465 Transcript_143295/m.399465 type:complete len:290 (-) Transcript_143295:74-943(-)
MVSALWTITGVLCTLCCGQRLDSSVALVQSVVRIHASEDWPVARGKYLVDNSRLQHQGPGVFWRRSKNTTDIEGREHYAAWGTIVEGYDLGDGWLKVGSLYLPTHHHGVQVVSPQEVVNQPDDRKRIRIRFQPTEIQAQDGSWIPCEITGLGSEQHTFNVLVTPPNFASYTLTNVPASQLKKVEHERYYASDTLPAKGTGPAVVREAKDEEGSIELIVDDLEGNALKLKVLRRSPLRTTMRMACEHAGLPWDKCQSSVRFVRKGKELSEDSHPFELGLMDGETIQMLKA